MENNTNKPMHSMTYKKFAIMMIVSFFIMYFVMFLNLSAFDHYYTSVTRIYMTVLMISAMGIVMMGMMGNMYPNRKTNQTIMAASAVVFIVVLFALRTQTPIGDVQYMKAMIPHHSSAILTSKNADIKDPEVRKLADDIIAAQEREIGEMKAMLEKLNQ